MENNNEKTGLVPATFNFFDKEQFETMQRVCKLFSSSELVPDMYKTDLSLKDGVAVNPENKAMANCMIAIEMAQRIGASPLMIMQNMVIIYGRPSWSSKFLIATINTCGRFNPLQYKFENLGKVGKINITTYEKKWVSGTNGSKGYYKNEAKITEFDGTQIDNIQCIAFTTTRTDSSKLESSPIDIVMAIQEGWYTKAGSKWKTMTKQMLMYRAASFWTSAYAPELSMGMKTEYEVIDTVDIPYVDVTGKSEEEINNNANKGEEISFSNIPEQKIESEHKEEPQHQETASASDVKPEQANGSAKPEKLF